MKGRCCQNVRIMINYIYVIDEYQFIEIIIHISSKWICFFLFWKELMFKDSNKIDNKIRSEKFFFLIQFGHKFYNQMFLFFFWLISFWWDKHRGQWWWTRYTNLLSSKETSPDRDTRVDNLILLVHLESISLSLSVFLDYGIFSQPCSQDFIKTIILVFFQHKKISDQHRNHFRYYYYYRWKNVTWFECLVDADIQCDACCLLRFQKTGTARKYLILIYLIIFIVRNIDLATINEASLMNLFRLWYGWNFLLLKNSFPSTTTTTTTTITIIIIRIDFSL